MGFLLALLSLFLSTPVQAAQPPLCSREGFYFLGATGKQRGIINSTWSPTKDPHYSKVYVSCSGKASKVCKKSMGRLNITVSGHKPQYSPLILEFSEKNMISLYANKLNFMKFFPHRVTEGTEVVLYLGTATKALCKHSIQIVP